MMTVWASLTTNKRELYCLPTIFSLAPNEVNAGKERKKDDGIVWRSINKLV
jgi:hypothetical protein